MTVPWDSHSDVSAYDGEMPPLPAGTVTFVFTDVEGSTALLKQLGERYGDVLSQHRRIVRQTFIGAGGSEIDTQGDAFFFAFPRAREAVTAAVGVFPLGERHLKGIDEPERVYELEIEGVPATPEPEPEPTAEPPAAPRRARRVIEKDFERRVESFGDRLADSIQRRVLRSLE